MLYGESAKSISLIFTHSSLASATIRFVLGHPCLKAFTALNAHFHFHLVVLDGVFSRSADGEVRCHEAALLQSEHWHEVQHVVQRRVLRYFRTHGLLDEADAHGMLSWQGSGGFSIDASVRIEGEDRAGVERLLRYCARPPFALERLYAPGGIVSLSSPESRLIYRLPKPAPDGRTELVRPSGATLPGSGPGKI